MLKQIITSVTCALGLILLPLEAQTAPGKNEKGNSFLLFNIQVAGSNENVAEKLTEKLYQELIFQSSVRVTWLHNARDTSIVQGAAPTFKVKSRECDDAQCAGEIAKKLGFDFAITGNIRSQGSGFRVRLEVVNTETFGVVHHQEKDFRQSKREVIRHLPVMGRELGAQINRPYFPKKFNPIQAPPPDAASKAKAGWRSAEFDPLTAHLEGTRLAGELRDTLKAGKSPYILTGNSYVPGGATLVIEPGVTIYIGGEFTNISVLGRILANGTRKEPIRILSGRRQPAPWDWDRIVFRSRQRSHLEYVHLSHSNYGVVVKNGAVSLSHCDISRNSLRGVYMENSHVEIRDSKIHDGHLIGVQVGEYSEAVIERSDITGNQNGVNVMDYGSLTLRQAHITGNDRGLLLMDSVGLIIENSRVENNRVGVSSSQPVSGGAFVGLKNNGQNLSIIRREHVASLVGKPAPIKQGREPIRSDKSRTGSKSFSGGIKSLRSGGGYQTGVIGNLAIGSEYHLPESAKNTTNQPLPTGQDTVAPGDEFPQDKVIPGYYQTASLFTTLNFGNYSIDGNLDMRWDEWGDVQLDAVTFKSVVGSQQFGVGDFVENGSEITLSSLPMRGLKYSSGYWHNRQGAPRLVVRGAVGEAERPFDEGERVLGSYLERKSEGTAVPQKMAGIAGLEYKVTPGWDLKMRYIFSQDRRDGILRPDLSRTAVTAQDPLLSNLVGAESEWRWLKDKVRLTAEMNVGTVDSLTQAYNLAVVDVLDEEGLNESQASNLSPLMQPTTRDSLRDANLSNALGPLVDSNAIIDSLTDLGQTGDIPEALREARLTELNRLINLAEGREDDKQEELDASKDLGFRWEDQGAAARLGLNVSLAGFSLEGAYTFVGANYYTGGNPFLTKDQRRYDLSLTSDLGKKVQMNSRYALYVENASSGGRYKNLLGFGEGSELGFNTDEGFQADQEAAEAIRPKFTHDWDANMRYNPFSILEVQLSYGLMYKQQDQGKELDADSAVIFADPAFAENNNTTSTEVVRYNNFDYRVDADAMAAFQTAVLANDLPLADVYRYKELDNDFGVKTKLRMSRWGNVSMGSKWKIRNDFSDYKNDTFLGDFSLEDSTLRTLGFYRLGEDEFHQDYDAALSLKNSRLSNKIDGGVKLKSKIKRDEKVFSWDLRNNFNWKIIKKKLKFSFTGKIKFETTREDEDRYYVFDNQGEKRFYYQQTTQNGETAFANLSDDEPGSFAVTSIQPDSLIDQIHREGFRRTIRENDYFLEWKLRYNFNSKFYSETVFLQEWYMRPDQLDQQYSDLAGKLKLFYSF